MDVLLRKIQRLGLWFRVVLFLGALSTLGGVTATIWFFKHRLEISQEVQNFSQRVARYDQLEANLDLLGRHSGSSHQDYFVRRTAVEKLKENPQLAVLFEVDPKTYAISSEKLDQLRAEKNRELRGLNQSLVEKLDQFDNTTEVTIVFGFLTLLFGLILPSALLFVLSLAIRRTQKVVEKQVARSFVSFVHAQTRYGEEAFKSPRFWAEVLLILAEGVDEYWSTPLTRILSHLAPILRSEVSKFEREEVLKSA